VTDGDGNRGGVGGGNSDSDSGGGRQQRGQATINNMQRRSAVVATAGGGGGGERRWTKTTTAAAIAAAMAEEAVVAMAATAATVAEATAAETERQNSRAGIISLANVVCRPVYNLANSGNILASFLASACASKLFAGQISYGYSHLHFSTSQIIELSRSYQQFFWYRYFVLSYIRR
jgi:hypothetical protein